MARLEHQHTVPWRKRVDQRRLPSPCARGRVHRHKGICLEKWAQTFQDFLWQFRKFSATMINDGLTDRPQDSSGNVCRTAGFYEVLASMSHIIHHSAANV